MKRSLTQHRHWLILGALLLSLAILLAEGLRREYQRAGQETQQLLLHQSKVVEDNLGRQIEAIGMTIDSLVADLPYWAQQADGRKRAVHQLESMEAAMTSVRTFLVLDAQGIVTLSNREELIGRNFKERAYFQVPKEGMDPKALYVSPPFKSVLGVFLINLSRVVLNAQGEFAGVVSVGLDPLDWQILLKSVNYATDMRAMLVHGDGVVFISEPAPEGVLGKNLAVPESFFSQHITSQNPVSAYEGRSYATGDFRISLLRSIAPPALRMNTPLVLVISRTQSAVYAAWQKQLQYTLLGYTALLLGSVLGLRYYRHQQAQRRLVMWRLRLATQAANVGIWEYDRAKKTYIWDAQMFTLFGLDAHHVNARNDEWVQLLLPGEFDRIGAATRACVDEHTTFDLSVAMLHPEGEVRHIRIRGAAFGEEDRLLIGTTEDVTKSKLQEAELRIAATAFNSQESFLVTDASEIILRVNHAFSDLFGYLPHEVIGQTPRLLRSGRHDKAFYQCMWAEVGSRGFWQGEIWNQRKNGSVFPLWLSITAVTDPAGVVTHYLGAHTDITLRKAAEEEIKQLAFYDPLTRLPNRRVLHDRLQQALAQAQRGGTNLALIFVDLDKFKPVNDQHGHAVGDQLLQGVAQRLTACVRESDTVARVGGDEFVLLLPLIADQVDAVLVAEKVHAVLRQEFVVPSGQSLSISSSAGVAIYPEHGTDEAALMQNADAAMYHAKAAGRDRFVVYSEATASETQPVTH